MRNNRDCMDTSTASCELRSQDTHRLNLLVLIRVGCRNIHIHVFISYGRYVVGLKQQLKAHVSGGYIRIADTFALRKPEKPEKRTSPSPPQVLLAAWNCVCAPSTLTGCWCGEGLGASERWKGVVGVVGHWLMLGCNTANRVVKPQQYRNGICACKETVCLNLYALKCKIRNEI